MTPCPWERTLGKVTMQTGVLIHCQLSSHLLPLHLYLCLLPFFSFFWITGPVSLFSSSYQSSISISLTHFSSTPLIFSFIFPPRLQLSSTEPLTGCWRLSELVTRTWSQHLKKKSLIRSSFSLTGLVLIYRFFFFPIVLFQQHPADRHLTCKNLKRSRSNKSCVIVFDVWTHDCHIFFFHRHSHSAESDP